MLPAFLLFAQDAPAPTPWYSMLIWMLPMVVLFYFLMIRPMRRQEQQRQLLVNNLEKGDKVQTAAGIIGHVVAVAEKEDEVTVKVDDNCRLKMIKSSIVRNLTKEEKLKAPTETAIKT